MTPFDPPEAARSGTEGETPPRTVLFLCTGNYYRSRFAEAFFNHVAAGMGLPWRASSRGLALELGVNNVGAISAAAARRLAALGIAAAGCQRTPIQVCEGDLEGADLIVALKELEHRPLLLARHPSWVEKVGYWHIHDGDCAPPAEALPAIEQAVLALAARLMSGRSR